MSNKGCGNHGCIIEKPKGQGTNGRCKCVKGHKELKDINPLMIGRDTPVEDTSGYYMLITLELYQRLQEVIEAECPNCAGVDTYRDAIDEDGNEGWICSECHEGWDIDDEGVLIRQDTKQEEGDDG